ncbi:hypothetical protein ES703_32298 [subsurface metagenome]
MIPMKSLDKIGKKYVDRAAVATDDYEDGIENPKKDWEKESLDAEDNYKTAIIASIARKARPAGIKKAGTKKWQDKAIAKKGRWAPGISEAEEDYKAGYAPYRDVVGKVVLPEKYPAGDIRNYKRSQAVGEAQHNLKIGKT